MSAEFPKTAALSDEARRLHFLSCTNLLDTAESPEFDQITKLASEIFDVPISLVSLVDANRQWFKSRFGLDVKETDRSSSFCAYTIENTGVFVVEDAASDERFHDNPLVVGSPFIRFYAGAPLVLPSGDAIGALCIIDRRPRRLSPVQQSQLVTLARLTVGQIELRQQAGLLNAITRLPNRTKLFEDLQSKSWSHGALALIEVMSHECMLTEARVVGTAILDNLAVVMAGKLKEIAGADMRVYHVEELRFCLALNGGNRSEWEKVLRRAMARIDGPFDFGGRILDISSTAGLVEFDAGNCAPVDVLRKAAIALHIKAGATAPYAWHDETADAAYRRSNRLVTDIPTGILKGEFRLVYQPKFNLRENAFTGVEALARWRHGELGDISPAEFIPLVEGGGLIHGFTRWVLTTALAQLRAWTQQGLDLTMAVNVSAKNLEDPGFVTDLARICRDSGIDTVRLHIECTETAVMTSKAAQQALQKIQKLGAEISLDDFGMGYCNFACLGQLPIKLLKLDQSLIRPIGSDPRAWRLVQSLIGLGHSLDYWVLAEGVETETEYSMLAAAGCDALQGYYFSKPLEADALAIFLAHHRDSQQAT